MSKKVIKPLVLVIVFLVATIIFDIAANKVNEDLTTSMSEATLPIMSFAYNGIEINSLHGYVGEMDSLAMRDTVTPLAENRILPMKISTYGNSVDKIHYEIRSIDGERLVAETDVDDYGTAGNVVSADLKIQNLLEPEAEYLMKFTLTSGTKNIYYYTRLMQTTECNVDECLAFAVEFNEKTLDRNSGQRFLPTFLDAAVGDVTTLNYVDLSCTLGQVMWGKLQGAMYGSPNVSFKEINDSYNVIIIDYIMTTASEEGDLEYYNVEEYYRLRLAPERMYVLNYERRTNQIFKSENSFVLENGDINLGIRDPEVEYKTNEAGSIICFEQEGDLWCFNRNTNELQQIFSFRSTEGIDERENWNQHDIKIVHVDEAGSIDFVVYGYMNRGDHEGQVGTVVYHYDGIAHTIEEEAFIPSDTSFEVLKADMGHLIYENDKGVLYLLLQGNIYTLDLATFQVSEAVSNLEADGYAVSKSGKYIGWVESDAKYSSESLNLMNIKTDTVEKITAGPGKYVRPLAFIEDDFIYGVANTSEVTVDAAGNTIFPMESLIILNTGEDKLEVLKEYVPKFGKITDILVNDYTINVNLTNGNVDSIMNRTDESEKGVRESTIYDERKETQIVLKTIGKYKHSKIKSFASKGVLVEEDRTVEIKKNQRPRRYYVYARGKVMHASDSISEAIAIANRELGVVLDAGQHYVWMRARKTYSDPFADIVPSNEDMEENSVIKCVSAMLNHEGVTSDVGALVENGATVKSAIRDNIPGAVLLDVSGCVVEDIIFYVSAGSPVLAMVDNNTAILVTGYTTSSIYYYDPVSGSRKTASFDEANEMFISGGKRFITYLKR